MWILSTRTIRPRKLSSPLSTAESGFAVRCGISRRRTVGGYCFKLSTLPCTRRQLRAHSARLICVPASQSFRQPSTVSSGARFWTVSAKPPAPPVAGLGTRPLPKTAGSCGFDPPVPVPLLSEGIVVLVLEPGSGRDPCGRGINRDGAKISEFERLGVTGPVGVEPRAGAPRDNPGEVAPLLVPELVPPEPEVWAPADPIERTTASAAKRYLCWYFMTR
jgi:hypothetical protein